MRIWYPEGMHAHKLDEAREKPEELIQQAASGEVVVISTDEGESFKIVPMKAAKPRPRFGSAQGWIRIGDDFDDPIPGFEPYMP